MGRTEVYGVEIRGKETLSKPTKKAETGMKKLGTAISAVKVHIIAVTAAIYAFGRAIISSVDKYAIQEQAVARLTQALRNQNELTQENIDSLTQQAKALQRVTVFGDEQIISAQAMLASFALTTEQIKKMTPRMLDVATMTSKATGGMMDLEGAAKFVGMALGGQAGRLTQAGIRLTDYQKKTFQAANETERFNMLLKIFDDNAKGLALSVGATATAITDKLKNAMSDLMETVGKDFITLLNDLIDKNTELQLIGNTTSEGFEISRFNLHGLRKEVFKNVESNGQLVAITKELAEAFQRARDNGLSFQAAYSRAVAEVERMTKAEKDNKEAVDEDTNAIDENTVAIDKNTESLKKNVEVMDEAERARSRGVIGWQEGTGIRRAQETIDPETGESTWS